MERVKEGGRGRGRTNFGNKKITLEIKRTNYHFRNQTDKFWKAKNRVRNQTDNIKESKQMIILVIFLNKVEAYIYIYFSARTIQLPR